MSKQLWVFVGEHHTLHEGGTTKVHVSSDDEAKSLCGFNSQYAGGTGGQVDLVWLTQPDPDDQICKKCKRIAIQILNRITNE